MTSLVSLSTNVVLRDKRVSAADRKRTVPETDQEVENEHHVDQNVDDDQHLNAGSLSIELSCDGLSIEIVAFLIFVREKRDRVRHEDARVQNEQDHHPIPSRSATFSYRIIRAPIDPST